MLRRCRGGGNVGIGFIDFQGWWEGRKTALPFSGLSSNRHFHGPLPMPHARHADFLISSNITFFARCIRRAASVSLIAAATRLSALILSPGRKYRSEERSVGHACR